MKYIKFAILLLSIQIVASPIGMAQEEGEEKMKEAELFKSETAGEPPKPPSPEEVRKSDELAMKKYAERRKRELDAENASAGPAKPLPKSKKKDSDKWWKE
jgi:hypothetical protein